MEKWCVVPATAKVQARLCTAINSVSYASSYHGAGTMLADSDTWQTSKYCFCYCEQQLLTICTQAGPKT